MVSQLISKSIKEEKRGLRAETIITCSWIDRSVSSDKVHWQKQTTDHLTMNVWFMI